MNETALTIEVPEAESVVGAWRERHDPGAVNGSPCHVTVLYPFVPLSRWDESARARVAGVLALHDAFDFELTRVDEFPGVLWLRPEPDAPFRALRNSMWQEFPEHPPFGGEFPDSQPHLTVAFTQEGVIQAALKAEIERSVEGGLPVSCHAARVTYFSSDDVGRWSRHESFAIGK